MQEEITLQKKKIRDLENEINRFEASNREDDENADKLNRLYKLGLIDENGDPVAQNSEMRIEFLT